MSMPSRKILLDTNVWLDKYIPTRPGAETARQLLSACVMSDAAVLFPLRALNDVYWQVKRHAKTWIRDAYGDITEAFAAAADTGAWECIDNMMELGAPIGADVTDVWTAQRLRSVHADFEDDMVVAAAKRAEVDYLVTSDRQLIYKATVPALTPQDMLALLRAEAV